MQKLNPWGNDLINDYDSLFKEFGLQHLSPELLKKLSSSKYFRRGLVFAHRDLDKFVAASERGEPLAVMSGIKPSSEFHLGSKMTAEEIIFFQKIFGARAFYCIADFEAYADNGLNFEQSYEFAVDNVSDLLALGLDKKNLYVYRQSTSNSVKNLAQIFSKRITLATLESLYGHQNLGLYMAVLNQLGDILQPQLKEFGGPKHTVVPVGIDQDPHIRLTRDLAAKMHSEYGFITPSSTYHQFFRALNGETKMSKRDPMSVMTLNDSGEPLEKKMRNTFTGGRATAEEQRRLGGEIEKCVFFELMKFHFIEDDARLKQMRVECTTGKNLCGECKQKFGKDAVEFLEKHQEKKKKYREVAIKLIT